MRRRMMLHALDTFLHRLKARVGTIHLDTDPQEGCLRRCIHRLLLTFCVPCSPVLELAQHMRLDRPASLVRLFLLRVLMALLA
jgi:hypothetical protein